MTRSSLRMFVILVTTALGALLVAPSATAAAAPYCGITWGSLAKSGTQDAVADTLRNVRAGEHACFDRLVIDLGGQDVSFDSYDVRYVSQVYSDGKGDPVPVRGAADLQVTVLAPAYDDGGHATFAPANKREVVDVTGYETFRQVAWAGSFEGRTTIALGVRARLPFRVFTLDGVANSGDTPRLVIDVAHRW